MKSSRLLDAVLYFGTRVFLQLFRIGEIVFGFEIGAYLGRRRDLHPLSCARRAAGFGPEIDGEHNHLGFYPCDRLERLIYSRHDSGA